MHVTFGLYYSLPATLPSQAPPSITTPCHSTVPLPLNRATRIPCVCRLNRVPMHAQQFGPNSHTDPPRRMQVRGDVFVARVFDDDDGFERLDFHLSDVSASAPWVAMAAQQRIGRLREPAQTILARIRAYCVEKDAGKDSSGKLAVAARRDPTPAEELQVCPPPPPPPPSIASGCSRLAPLVAIESYPNLIPCRTAARPRTAFRGCMHAGWGCVPLTRRAVQEQADAAFKAHNHAAAVELFGRCAAAAGPAEERLRLAALSHRALSHLKLRHPEAALADCEAVLARQPHNTAALYRKAAAYRALGRRDDACLLLRLCLELQPHNLVARGALEKLEPRVA